MGRGKSFPKEFKENAVRLSVTSGKSVAQVAKDLGISQHTLHVWRRDAISERRFPVADNETDPQKKHERACSSTSRYSTTASDFTRRSGTSHQLSMKRRGWNTTKQPKSC